MTTLTPKKMKYAYFYYFHFEKGTLPVEICYIVEHAKATVILHYNCSLLVLQRFPYLLKNKKIS